jgi:hypothetical protein
MRYLFAIWFMLAPFMAASAAPVAAETSGIRYGDVPGNA